MHRQFYDSETYILIPGTKNYKAVNLTTGIVKKASYEENYSKKSHDIMLRENGRNHLLFRIEDKEVTFFVTSKCNHSCIMCPQKLNIDSELNDLILQRTIENLDYEVLNSICFTGGEPLLKMNFIEQIVKNAPERIFITILTNGSIMPTKLILKSSRVKLCIPLYAPYDELHNKMTGSSSFYTVIENLMKISQYKTLIELRFVLTALNCHCLLEFSRFVWRNLPFVQDVAFMGIELTENALKNKNKLWCNPKVYIKELQSAVSYLDDCGITAWIYNLPLCLIDRYYQKFVVKSISAWKVKYLEKCEKCNIKPACGGMFFSDINELEKIL